MLKLPFIVALMALAGSIHAAEEQTQPWAHPDVLRAAMQINMNAEQRPKFQASVTEFLQGYGADVQRLMRANNQTGLPRKIAQKRRYRVSAMDEQMGALFGESQYSAYETYRDTLLAKMAEQARARRR